MLVQAVPLRGHRESVDEGHMNGVQVLLRPNTKDLDAAREVNLAYCGEKGDECTGKHELARV